MLSLLIAFTLSAATAPDTLAGRPECVAFEWHGSNASDKGAIIIPVMLDGHPVQWQLDTGADVNMIYGDSAERLGLSKRGASRFAVRNLRIGAARLGGSVTFVRRDMAADGDVIGTLGLNSLVGRIAVLDYPRRRFCLFSEADLPEPFWSAEFTGAVLRNRKFFLSARLGTFESDALMFDTGSSETPLNVDLPLWSQLTDMTTVDSAKKRIEGSAWGKPITLFGALATEPMAIGNANLGRQVIYTEKTNETFASRDYRIDGIIGNAPFWDGIVVLDLTVRMRFAYLKP